MNTLLTSPRLYIKEPTLNDFDSLFNLQSNSEVMSYIGNGVRSQEEVMNGLEKAISHYKQHQFSLGSVFLKSSPKFIGRAGLIYFNYDDSQADIELAYALLPEYWGIGYATELAQALVSWGFDQLSIPKLIAVVHPKNSNSQKVLIKAGMMNTGTINYWNKDVLRFEVRNPQYVLND
jgi:[ribosomal protein S5]-alanine N-acetyltransferase